VKPLLFIDVDGPLNPRANSAGRRPAGYQTHRLNPTIGPNNIRWTDLNRKLLRVWLNPGHGAELLRLPFDLVWATTWEDEANEFIGPNIGLPTIPAIKWSDPYAYRYANGVYFKTEDVIRYADGRPFAWVDDEIGVADKDLIERTCGKFGMPHWVNPSLGLLASDFRSLADWANSLSEER
jgi:hypothetical protein